MTVPTTTATPLLTVKDVRKDFALGAVGGAALVRTMISELARSFRPSRPSSLDGRFEALKGVSLTIRAGEVVGLIGRNGAGKSTLLRIVNHTALPSSGEVGRRARMFWMNDLDRGIDPFGSIETNLRLIANLAGVAPRRHAGYVDQAIEQCCYVGRISAPVRTLRAHEFTRLALALSEAIGAHVLLADEVLAQANAPSRAIFEDVFSGYVGSESAALIVSHDLEAISRLCTRVVWIDGGLVVMDGAPDTVTAAYAGRATRGPAARNAAAGTPFGISLRDVGLGGLEAQQLVLGCDATLSGVLDIDRPDFSATLSVDILARDQPIASVTLETKFSHLTGASTPFYVTLPLGALAAGHYSLVINVMAKAARARRAAVAATETLGIAIGGDLLAAEAKTVSRGTMAVIVKPPGRWIS